ncbi:MAG: sigma-70 family RNA polymerase sigma factor [Verrucomicrobia bacterium]|nr:sigma-70 family RNA polymerase sigma factor [Verrucomicrobiota bacterium]
MTTDPPHTPVPADIFATTHWTVVVAAGRRTTPQSEQALEELCRTYWFPLYAFVRRRGHSPPDAQDLTQEFFARLLAKHWIESADREKGRFRTFLLTAMSRFLANEWDRAATQKRGGHAAHLPLDTETAETRYEADAALTLSPDRLYDRQWAMTLLDRALTRLRTEYERAGKTKEFAVLSPFLTAERGEIPYAAVAKQIGTSETTARQAVHRVRKRFREVFREKITQTVASPEEAEVEIRHLLAALSG